MDVGEAQTPNGVVPMEIEANRDALPTSPVDSNVDDRPQDNDADADADETKRGPPKPVSWIVTRWQQDEFSAGSYFYLPTGGTWQVIDELRRAENIGASTPRVYFAGEHCSEEGRQYVHGAVETGIKAAHDILVAGIIGHVARI